MKRVARAVCLATAVPLALVGLGVTRAEAISDDCTEFTVPVSRLVNPKSDASLLTQFNSELTGAAGFGFSTDDGVKLTAAPNAGADLVAVWRIYNPSTYDFSLASEGADLDAMKAAGYTAQFRQFYASTVNNDCVSTAYRLQNGKGKTRIAVGSPDRDSLTGDGWTVASSGIFYAVPGGSTPPPPPNPDPVPAPDPGGDEFTVAVMPDTQQETWTDTDTRFKNRSQWLVDNASSLNLKFATHVGDVVDWGNVVPAQFTRVKNGLSPLNGKIPYSLTVGNHDTAAVCIGGSACPGADAKVTVRDTTAFNNAFTESMFTDLKGEYESGKVDNSYSTFTAGGQNWMVLNLELWQRQGAIDWAKSVVASHANYNVIVATHSYLEPDGSISQSAGGYGATSPQHLFDTLIKVYPNIKIVVSGHVGGGASRVDTGTNGNKILSLLQCYHSRTTNPVRLLKISVSKGTVKNWVYAPYTNETLAGETTTTGLDFTP
jgi:hypothetical protein